MGGFLVPVIAVFTKYDQFRRDIKIKLEDEGRDSEMNIDDEVENLFHQHFLASLRETPPYVHLESENFVINHRVLPNCCAPAGMHIHRQPCTNLIEITASALSGDVVGVMLLAVQKDN